VETGKIVTDFCSFYSLPSHVLKNEKYNQIKAAYSYFTVATKNSLENMFQHALIMANKEKFDVFNALDIMENFNIFKVIKISPLFISCRSSNLALAMGICTIISITGSFKIRSSLIL